MSKRTYDPVFNSGVSPVLKPDNISHQFHKVAHDVVQGGIRATNRTGIETVSTFSEYMKVSCAGGALACVQTRFVPKLTFLRELLWFISGSTDIGKLISQNVHLWDAWVRPESAVYGADDKLIGGDIGTGAYGKQWRFWEDTRIIEQRQVDTFKERGYTFVTHVEGGGSVVTRNIDQLKRVENTLRTNPLDRRMVVTAWNPGALEDQALPPCHSIFMFKATPKAGKTEKALALQMTNWLLYAIFNQQDPKVIALAKDILFIDQSLWQHFSFTGKQTHILGLIEELLLKRNNKLDALYEAMPQYTLNLHLTCRSQDLLVGTVANIFQYSLMLNMMAKVVGMVPGNFSWVGVDTHVYLDQVDAYEEQYQQYQDLKKQPAGFTPCWVRITGNQKTMDDFKFEDFEFIDGAVGPKLKFPIAV